MDRVKGKVAIVTGGALRIGRSACHLLAKEGAAVAVTDILDEEGARAAAAITGANKPTHELSAEEWDDSGGYTAQ